MPPEVSYLTPPELAKVWRVSPEKVIAMIRRGELAAVNLASNGTTRPRFRISPEAIAAFEHGHQAMPRPALPPRRQRTTEANLKRFI